MDLRTILLGITSLVGLGVGAQNTISFHPFVWESMSADPKAVALGDLNVDGLLDAAVCIGDGGPAEDEFKVRVYLQQPGEGLVFSTQYPFPAPLTPRAIAIGDMNDDGANDIVLGYGDFVGILFQDAQHEFSAIVPMLSGSEVDGLALGDMNNDGRTDIVASHMYENHIRVFLQQQGEFTQVTYPHPTAGRNELNIDDLNGDGFDDVLMMPGQFSTALYLFQQDISGGTAPLVQVSAGPSNSLYQGAALGDVNGDGLMDVMATRGGNVPNAQLVIWQQNSTTHLLEPLPPIPVADLPDAVETADLDCDGRIELLVKHPGSIHCYQQDGDGVFDILTVLPIPYSTLHAPQIFAVGDVDDDGRPDIVTATYQGVSFLRNRTMPQELDSVLLSISVDTTFSNTMSAWENGLEVEWDTIGSYVISTTTYFKAEHLIRLDSVRTDSVFISYGTLCGRTVSDSLVRRNTLPVMDTLSTTIWQEVVTVDTVFVVGVQERMAGELRVVPNPTKGPVLVSGWEDLPKAECHFILRDKVGRVLGRGLVRSSPFLYDLTGELPGVYHLTLFTREWAITSTVVLVE